jgi:dTDP-4-dehydrorhamnose 3,5-epimerase-like enzyme
MKNIILMPGGISVDDRGSVSFVNDFDFSGVKRFYVVENHRVGFIRAWHGHNYEGKYVFVAKGAALIGAVDMKSESIQKYTLSDRNPKILYIPPGYANGFKTLVEDTRIIFYSTSTLQDSLNDDIRFPFDKWDIWKEDFR